MNKAQSVKPSKRYTGQGYIQTDYKTSRELYKYIWSLTASLPFEDPNGRNDYHRFLAHIYASTRSAATGIEEDYDSEKYIPLYSRLIDQEFGTSFSPHILKKHSLIEIKPHGSIQRRSREFRLNPKIFAEALEIEFNALISHWKSLQKKEKLPARVNLMTGRKAKNPIKSQLDKSKSSTRDTNIPKVIKERIETLEPCPFNPKYLISWVTKLKRKYEKEKIKLDNIKAKYNEDSPEYQAAKKEYDKAYGRYLNDSYCLNTILNQAPQLLKKKSKKGDPLYQYQAAYTPQNSGRITERHGGFQSASQYFKHLFFRDMEDLYYNYDLKNSQANILLQELKACNQVRKPDKQFKTAWLESYLEDPNQKNKLAKKIGLPVERWKYCFYAVIMGAEGKRATGAVFKAISEHFQGNPAKTQKVHRLFTEEAKELIQVTEKWRNYLYKTKNRRYHYEHGGIKYWKNACNMHYKDYGIIKDKNKKAVLINRLKDNKIVLSKKNINKCKRQLAAFILQGREAGFIHNLTILCSKNDLPVYKNEHDGIITGKKVPDRLVDRAAKKAKLEAPVLEIKELCPREKRLEMRNLNKV